MVEICSFLLSRLCPLSLVVAVVRGGRGGGSVVFSRRVFELDLLASLRRFFGEGLFSKSLLNLDLLPRAPLVGSRASLLVDTRGKGLFLLGPRSPKYRRRSPFRGSTLATGAVPEADLMGLGPSLLSIGVLRPLESAELEANMSYPSALGF